RDPHLARKLEAVDGAPAEPDRALRGRKPARVGRVGGAGPPGEPRDEPRAELAHHAVISRVGVVLVVRVVDAQARRPRQAGLRPGLDAPGSEVAPRVLAAPEPERARRKERESHRDGDPRALAHAAVVVAQAGDARAPRGAEAHARDRERGAGDLIGGPAVVVEASAHGQWRGAGCAGRGPGRAEADAGGDPGQDTRTGNMNLDPMANRAHVSLLLRRRRSGAIRAPNRSPIVFWT